MSEKAESFNKCGHCQGMFPADYTECPYCGKSVESYGVFDRIANSFLPKDRPMTKILAGLAVAVYLLMGLVAGGASIASPSLYTLIHFGAMFPPYVVEGEVWRLVTALFLHGDVLHIGFNLYALWIVGALVENSFGKSRFLLAFVVTGILSTVASFLWGFVAGDFAAAVPVPFLLDPANSATFATPSEGMSGALTGIDNAAHMGGFVAGLLLGLVLPLAGTASRTTGYIFGSAAAACGVAIVASLVLHGVNMPREYPNDVEAYPQGVFGMTVREADLSGDSVQGPWNACTTALKDIEAGMKPIGDADPLEKRAVQACDELRYVFPVDPTPYIWSAVAHAADNDKDGACTRARTAELMAEHGLRKTEVPRNRLVVESVKLKASKIRQTFGCD